ncbi:scavenger receptor class B member 1 [Drosophila innubila]|uniref:scavenger receptor class B member 1 n=1 Tax=Drosophila innubila TaxID=198719 RepID=UPI00148E3404|nr:scavenger receptor class B member 1 [Drosophila innubila]
MGSVTKSGCSWLKIVFLSLFCALNIYLFVISFGIDYKREMAKVHVQFSESMPTMDSWINSPFGKLKSYLFNVTNAEEFLSGRDKKVRLEQVGPITYSIVGYNDILNRTKSSVTFRKHRYRHVEFLPDESVAPDILNKTIVQFNSILIGAAAKAAQTHSMFTAIGFNAVTMGEKLFMPDSVYYFLWEFTRPGLEMISRWLSLVSNCGVLYNALKEKEEVFTVNIGTEPGVENFFRIQSYNDELLIQEQLKRPTGPIDESCPINVKGTLDNSLYPPFIEKDTPLNIMASESCRILPLHYQREDEHEGIKGYRYTLLKQNETAPNCLSITNEVRLPSGMFDVSKCVINDAPAAFSSPHFYGSSYDWTEHFEGLNPNAEEHEGFILLEPTSGIPLNEKYRFQSVTPMPNMDGYGHGLNKLSHVMVPTFWYEFEMGQLPLYVLVIMRIYANPYLQPILMGLQLFCAIGSLYFLVRLLRRLCKKICATPVVRLETVLNSHPHSNPESTLEHDSSKLENVLNPHLDPNQSPDLTSQNNLSKLETD